MRRLLATAALALALSPVAAFATTGGLLVEREGGLGVIRPDGGVRVLAPGGAATRPAVTSAGRLVTFVETGVAVSVLVVRDGTRIRRYAMSGTITWAPSPDGRYIAVATEDRLRLLEVKSGRFSAITSGAGAFSIAAWAPTSDALAYTSELGSTTVWSYSLPRRAAYRLSGPLVSFYPDVRFSPDGTRLLYGTRVDGVDSVWLGAVDGSAPVRISVAGIPATTLIDWSGGGGHFRAWVGDEEYVFDRLGNNPWRVPSAAQPDTEAVFSPTGERLAVVTQSVTSSTVLLRTGSVVRRIRAGFSRWGILWSPAGTVFSLNGYNGEDLALVTAAGAVRHIPGVASVTSWSPNSKAMLVRMWKVGGPVFQWVRLPRVLRLSGSLAGPAFAWDSEPIGWTPNSRAVVVRWHGRIAAVPIGQRFPAVRTSQAGSIYAEVVALLAGSRTLVYRYGGRVVIAGLTGAHPVAIGGWPPVQAVGDVLLSPDGRWVAWSGQAGVMLRSTAGTTPARRVGAGRIWAGARWSSDSTRIALPAPTPGRYVVIDVATLAAVGYWDSRSRNGTGEHEVASPDLRTVMIGDDPSRIAVRPINGSLHTLVAARSGAVLAPSWSPDSRTIAFTTASSLVGAPTISTVDTATAAVVLLGQAVGVGRIDWAAGGHAIVWTDYGGYPKELAIAGVADSLVAVVAANGDAILNWRPDGVSALLIGGGLLSGASSTIVSVTGSRVSLSSPAQPFTLSCQSGTWSPGGARLLMCGGSVYSDTDPTLSLPDGLTSSFWATATTIVADSPGGLVAAEIGATVQMTHLASVATQGSVEPVLPGPTPIPGVVLVQTADHWQTALLKLDGSGLIPFGPWGDLTPIAWLPG